MTIEATGRVLTTERGKDLVLLRSLALPQHEAWRFLTDAHLTEEWFGPWEGDARMGGAIHIRMRFEEGEPAVRARIMGCTEGEHLALQIADEYGAWNLELFLEADGEDDSLLRFVQHLDAESDVGALGPGWEYYLDLLVAATEGTEAPEFDQYYPALSAHFVAQL